MSSNCSCELAAKHLPNGVHEDSSASGLAGVFQNSYPCSRAKLSSGLPPVVVITMFAPSALYVRCWSVPLHRLPVGLLSTVNPVAPLGCAALVCCASITEDTCGCHSRAPSAALARISNMCALRTMLVEDEFHTCLCGTLVISLLAFFASMNEASPAQSDCQVCSRTALGYTCTMQQKPGPKRRNLRMKTWRHARWQ